MSVSIAVRAALRVQPWLWARLDRARQDAELTALQFVRSTLISAVAAHVPTAEIKKRADSAATAATAARAAIWAEIRGDLSAASDVSVLWRRPLRSDENPFAANWQSTKEAWTDAGLPWSFFADWYDEVLAGATSNWPLLEKIALLDPADWEGNDAPDKIARQIKELLERDTRTVSKPSALANAAVTDFRFDDMLRQMMAVGFNDDLAHFRDPALVQRFIDDLDEARDGLQDFIDFASDARGPSNAPAILETAARKLLAELERAEGTEHLRARRVITLARHLEGFLTEEAKCAELGATLTDLLRTHLGLLGKVCRTHLGPSLVVLGALDGLSLEGANHHDVVRRLEDALGTIDGADGSALVELSPEARAILSEMISDVRMLAAGIDEARSEAFADELRKRLARGAGQTTATIGRYVEKSSKHAEDMGKQFDAGVKWYHRWEKFSDIMEWLGWFGGGGGPPA